MKSILISIRPQHVANILNGLKTIEIRKKFPSDYVGWVYIYCTKNGTDCYGMPTDLVDYRGCAIYNKFKLMPKGEKVTTDDNQPRLNGKVVARFWCDKVETIFAKPDRYKEFYFYDASKLDMEDLLKQSCLEYDELDYYLDANDGYAIHITKLEIFDKPKEINEFKSNTKRFCERCSTYSCMGKYHRKWCYKPLTRAPQSYCFIEV